MFTMEELEPVAPGVKTESEKEYGVKKDYFITPVNKKKDILRSAVYIFLSAFFYSVSFHYFVTTCNFAPGGVGGVVAIVKKLLGIGETQNSGLDYSSLLFLVVNVPLLALAWKRLGKDFCIKTFIATIIITVTMFLLDNFIDPYHAKNID